MIERKTEEQLAEMSKDEKIQYLIDALVEYGIIELIDEPKEQGAEL